MQDERTKRLRHLIERPEILLAPGVYDAYLARCVERTNTTAPQLERMLDFESQNEIVGLPAGSISLAVTSERARGGVSVVKLQGY